MKKRQTWVVVSIIFIVVFILQTVFYLNQFSNRDQIEKAVESIFRNEAKSSNAYSIAEGLADLESLKLLKCLKFKKAGEQGYFLDHTFKEKNCSSSFLFLNGVKVESSITGIDGAHWEVEYFTNNSSSFYIALNLLRVILSVFVLLIIYFIDKYVEKKNQLQKARIENLEEKYRFARQVAHDIRSPVSSLALVIEGMQVGPAKNKIIRSSLNRIQEIAEDLLNIKKQNDHMRVKTLVVDLISPLIKIINEKKELINIGKNIEIEFVKDELENKFYSKIQINDFKRVLSNLLNNSIEAIENCGKVIVSLSNIDSYHVLTIMDNGNGVSDNHKTRVFEEGFSIGKKLGSGLGLYHAKKTIESWGGRLEFDSTLSVGTQVKLCLPAYFYRNDQNLSVRKVILIDDDELIRLSWETSALKYDIDFKAFETVSDFFSISDRLDRSYIVFIDSNLGEGCRGEDFIEKINAIGFNQVFICTGYEDVSFLNIEKLSGVVGKKPPW